MRRQAGVRIPDSPMYRLKAHLTTANISETQYNEAWQTWAVISCKSAPYRKPSKSSLFLVMMHFGRWIHAGFPRGRCRDLQFPTLQVCHSLCVAQLNVSSCPYAWCGHMHATPGAKCTSHAPIHALVMYFQSSVVLFCSALLGQPQALGSKENLCSFLCRILFCCMPCLPLPCCHMHPYLCCIWDSEPMRLTLANTTGLQTRRCPGCMC
jgi:hypothetical protein